jgi:CheY-like chemotaxis protein
VPSELREVAVNFIRNAVDAMPNGGQLGIRVRQYGSEAVLEVKDSGVGMDEATRKRIFEPFFTTKGPALGLGLGLSLAWGIVVRHNGKISVDSRPGGGTRFAVAFPVAGESAVSTPAEPAAHHLHGLRILVVDDEPLVLDSLARMLEHAGAVVHAEESAERALEWLDAHPCSCDVALTDHGMPGMTGLAFLGIVRDRHPGTVRALISGWGVSPPADADLGPAQTIFSKPITHQKLVQGLGKLLEGIHVG